MQEINVNIIANEIKDGNARDKYKDSIAYCRR